MVSHPDDLSLRAARPCVAGDNYLPSQTPLVSSSVNCSGSRSDEGSCDIRFR
jgi:hypothetical protein